MSHPETMPLNCLWLNGHGLKLLNSAEKETINKPGGYRDSGDNPLVILTLPLVFIITAVFKSQTGLNVIAIPDLGSLMFFHKQRPHYLAVL